MDSSRASSSSAASSEVVSNEVFQSLSILQTFSRVASIFLKSAFVRLFISIAAFFLVPITALMMFLVHHVVHTIFGNVEKDEQDDSSSSSFGWNDILGILIIMTGRFFLHKSIGILSDGAIAYAAAEICIGRRPSFANCMRVIVRRLLPLVAVGVLSFVAISLGYLLFVVVGLFVTISLYVAIPAMVVEDLKPLDGMMRAYYMSQGKETHFLACHLLLVGTETVVSHLVHIVGTGGRSTYLFSVWGTVLNMIPNMIFTPAFAILKMVLYLSVRAEREGLTAETLSDEIGHEGLLAPGGGIDGPDYRQLALMDEDADEAMGGGIRLDPADTALLLSEQAPFAIPVENAATPTAMAQPPPADSTNIEEASGEIGSPPSTSE